MLIAWDQIYVFKLAWNVLSLCLAHPNPTNYRTQFRYYIPLEPFLITLAHTDLSLPWRVIFYNLSQVNTGGKKNTELNIRRLEFLPNL